MEGRLALAGWTYALERYRRCGMAPTSGLLRMEQDPVRLRSIGNDWPLRRLEANIVSARAASKLAGVPLNDGGIHWRNGGLIDSAATVRALLANLDVETGHRYEKRGDEDMLILANGLGALDLLPKSQLPIRARLGQVSHIKTTDYLSQLNMPVAYGGYLTTHSSQDHHDVGASYDHVNRHEWATEHPRRESADQRNLAQLRSAIPGLPSSIDVTGGWIGLRAVTPDHVPIAGPLFDDTDIDRAYRLGEASPQPSAWGLLGLGSYGFSLAPLMAEFLCALIWNEPWPMPRTLGLSVHPARFRVRSLRRQPGTQSRAKS